MDTLTRTLTITLPLTPALVAGFAATVAHASKDAVTPVITAVRIDNRFITATDRYSAAMYEHTTLEESVTRHGEEGPADPDGFIIIPRDVVDYITKLKPGTLSQTITITPESVAVAWEGHEDTPFESRAFPVFVGNFPPVARLFPEYSADAASDVSPFALGVDNLAKLAKSAAIIGRADKTKNAPVRLQIKSAENGYKTAPILATIGRLSLLLQPSLILPR